MLLIKNDNDFLKIFCNSVVSRDLEVKNHWSIG